MYYYYYYYTSACGLISMNAAIMNIWHVNSNALVLISVALQIDASYALSLYEGRIY